MKRLYLSIALAISASPSQAETIAIRSGEHPAFSRLVIDFSDNVDWQEDREDRQYILTFADPDPRSCLRLHRQDPAPCIQKIGH
jgi:hypothetical protein